MEGGNKFKKRGRDAEEESFPGTTPTSKKQVTCYNNTNNIDELSCTQTRQLELHNLKVFDFPWLHEQEGIMCRESKDLFSLEDSFFSSTLHHPTNFCTIAGFQFESSCESETPSVAFPPSRDKSEMWPLDQATDDSSEGGRQIDGSDCIWAPLLNQPLQSTLNYT